VTAASPAMHTSPVSLLCVAARCPPPPFGCTFCRQMPLHRRMVEARQGRPERWLEEQGPLAAAVQQLLVLAGAGQAAGEQGGGSSGAAGRLLLQCGSTAATAVIPAVIPAAAAPLKKRRKEKSKTGLLGMEWRTWKVQRSRSRRPDTPAAGGPGPVNHSWAATPHHCPSWGAWWHLGPGRQQQQHSLQPMPAWLQPLLLEQRLLPGAGPLQQQQHSHNRQQQQVLPSLARGTIRSRGRLEQHLPASNTG
jgi:hypothetical protein